MLFAPVSFSLQLEEDLLEVVLDVLELQLHEVMLEEKDKEEDPADWQHCLSVGLGYRNCRNYRNCSRMYL